LLGCWDRGDSNIVSNKQMVEGKSTSIITHMCSQEKKADTQNITNVEKENITQKYLILD